MRRFLIIFLGLILSGLLSRTDVFAQSETIVVGRVTSSVDGAPMAGVHVFTFKTMAEAKAEYKVASDSYQMGYMPDFFKDIRTDMDGTYEVTIPMNGGIIFYRHPYKPILISAKGQSTWLCQCACGKKFIQYGGPLRKGKIKSFGISRFFR